MAPSDAVEWSELLGAYIIVGLTINDDAGRFLRQEQLHGRIVYADASWGLRIECKEEREGEHYDLPPDLRSVERAPPGEYRLTSTGAVIEDPDFTATWIVTKHDQPARD